MMQILVVDFETYYDRQFSLSKLTTEQYIRDPQFEVIGVSVKVGDGETRWFSGTKAQTKRWLEQFPWEDALAVAHNAMFDMAVLSWVFGIHPKRIADTLSMARALHAAEGGSLSLKALAERYELGVKGTEVSNALGKRRLDFTKEEMARYAEYCCNDTDLTYSLFTKLAVGFPLPELRLIDLTIKMFSEPVLELDKGVLVDHLEAVKAKKEELLGKAMIDKEQLMSNPKLADLLRSLGVEPPMKISPTTGKETYAFAKSDEGFKALLEHENIFVQSIVAARLGVKSTLEESRTERFIGIADRGTLPIPLRYYGAHTGRWSGVDYNMQNLPRTSPLKYAIKAPEGYVLVDCDSSQIEARTLAWLAGQEDLVAAFDAGEDVYKIMASAIYNKPVAEITKDERFIGKTTVLGCLAEGTPVLTDRGWVAIEEVATSDRLWDGEEWVCHQGLVPKGTKETLNLCGLWLTPDHRVLCGTQWLEAQSVVQDRNTLSQALDTGVVSWLSPGMFGEFGAASVPSSCNAIAGDQSTLWTGTTSRTSRVHGAPCAVNGKGIGSGIGNIAPCSLTPHTASASLTVCPPPSADATYLTTKHTPATEAGVSPYASSGETTAPSSYATPKLFRGGTTQPLTWTEPTTAGDMNPETSGLCLGQTTTPTVEKSVSYKRNLMTYDIAYAGPRNRYTVATNAGPIIVHNCGYGMGGAKFQAQLQAMGKALTKEECEYIIRVYRDTYPMIPALWKEANNALEAMISDKTAPIGLEGVLSVRGQEGVYLPSGLRVQYPNLRKERMLGSNHTEMVYDTKKGRSIIATRIYGGKAVENLCQALARIVIGEQMLMIARRYKVAMTVHDSVVALTPEGEAEEGQKFVEDCMRIRPKWAGNLPLNCESHVGKSYGG
jgi:DNA polymerase I-like protein with 3'-5' exonuclease and polymerase domains